MKENAKDDRLFQGTVISMQFDMFPKTLNPKQDLAMNNSPFHITGDLIPKKFLQRTQCRYRTA